MSTSRGAGEFREQGNRLFSERRYTEAIEAYTSAIDANGRVATYYTNRALCYLKTLQWSLAVSDCRRAIELDPKLVKANFFMGQALTELENYDEAIQALKIAHNLAREQGKNFGDDITAAIRLAKKKRWNIAEEKRVKQETELQSFLLTLLEDHRKQKLAEVEITGPPEATESVLNKINTEHAEKTVSVNKLFAEVDEKRKRREVPDYLCGKISYELMEEPVVAPSGISYDRKDIEDHLQKVGHFDPITRQELTQEQLIPNLALKEIIDSFVAENGWVEDY
ncbi:E3 ubiquitin-protein ligase CHIP-like [Dysidea avara]|uniref:E3 ubiquitin-protein ligase CHIP-like n=1 Tax=Dysidea avara TaxID=196820 RepID=UPI0033191687